MDFLPDIPLSYSPSVQPTFAVDSVQFGDGYQQRRPAGLSSVTESWDVSWNQLDQQDYDILYRFLMSRRGVYAFLWQPPWDNAAKRWVCTDMSSVRPSALMRGSIQATLKEDHNP